MTKTKRRAPIAAVTRNSFVQGVKVWVAARWTRLRARHRSFMARRPHRSFRRTRRRDYARSLKLPGYVAFTAGVWQMISRQRHIFIPLIVLYAVLMLALGGITNQSTYEQINDLLKESAPTVFTGGAGKLGQAGLLLLSTFATGPTATSAEQQVLLGLMMILAWLTTVWLLRELLLKRKPRLRDGLYNSSAPLLSTLAILAVFVLQSLPVGVVALMYAGLSAVGLVDGGFASMLFAMFALAVTVLVLYWLTGTFIALVVVTLPGMYPMRALRASSDLVVGRRLRILFRLLWALAMIVVVWAVVAIPIVLLDSIIKSSWPTIESVPTMPVVAALLTSWSTVWLASYIYLLYRRVVDDDAKPA